MSQVLGSLLSLLLRGRHGHHHRLSVSRALDASDEFYGSDDRLWKTLLDLAFFFRHRKKLLQWQMEKLVHPAAVGPRRAPTPSARASFPTLAGAEDRRLDGPRETKEVLSGWALEPLGKGPRFLSGGCKESPSGPRGSRGLAGVVRLPRGLPRCRLLPLVPAPTRALQCPPSRTRHDTPSAPDYTL